jgi:transcriptional regulator with XRE-family HTH domain
MKINFFVPFILYLIKGEIVMLSAEKLAYYRSVSGISQKELAERIGCTKSYISMLENRKQEFNEEFYDKWIKAIHGTFDYRLTEEYKIKQAEKEAKKDNKKDEK